MFNTDVSLNFRDITTKFWLWILLIVPLLSCAICWAILMQDTVLERLLVVENMIEIWI
jgi:hypothetical protein